MNKTVTVEGKPYEVVRFQRGSREEVFVSLQPGERAVIASWAGSLDTWKVLRPIPEIPNEPPTNPDPFADGRVPGTEEEATIRAELQKAKDGLDVLVTENVGIEQHITAATISGEVAELRRWRARKTEVEGEIKAAEILVARCELAVAYLERALVRQAREEG